MPYRKPNPARPATGHQVRLSHHGAIRHAGNYEFGANSPGYTFGSVVQLPGPFDSVRLGFANNQGSAALAGGLITLGATETNAGSVGRAVVGGVDVSGDGFLGMKKVGFDNGGGRGVLNTQSGIASGSTNQPQATTLSVPALGSAGSNNIMGVVTDWAYVPSTPRVDGGAGNLLTTFTQVPSGQASQVSSPKATMGAAGNASLAGVANTTWRSAYAAGAITPAALNAAVAAGSAGFGGDVWTWIEALFQRKALTIVAMGDSIQNLPTAGGVQVGTRCNFVSLAAAMLNSVATPVCPYNFATYAATLGQTSQNGAYEIAQLPFAGVAVIQGWSGNTPYDSLTGGWTGLMLQSLYGVIHACELAGVLPIICTPVPQYPRFTSNYGLWEQCDAHIRNDFGGLYPILDLNGLWGLPETPYIYSPACDFGDGLHPSDYAVQLAASDLCALIQPYLPQLIAA